MVVVVIVIVAEIVEVVLLDSSDNVSIDNSDGRCNNYCIMTVPTLSFFSIIVISTSFLSFLIINDDTKPPTPAPRTPTLSARVFGINSKSNSTNTIIR